MKNVIAVHYFERVESAKTPADLFVDRESARSTYRRLARIVHPDANGGESRAVDAFAKLSMFWDQYNGKITSPRVAAGPANASKGLIFESKRHTYFVGDLAKRTDFANIYPAEYIEDTHQRYAALKIPRSPKNNDLIENEVRALKTLKDNKTATDDAGNGKGSTGTIMSTAEWMEMYRKDPKAADDYLRKMTAEKNTK